MSAYVLVHGAWHGGWCWRRVKALLRAAGHDVYTPTLTGLGDRAHLRACVIDLNTHIEDVVALIEWEDLDDVVLVGHSLGGIKVPAIADRVAHKVRHVVNVDGMIPTHGQSIKDMIPDVWRESREKAAASGAPDWAAPPDWDFGVAGDDLVWLRSKLTPDPITTWETPIMLESELATRIPKTFVHCTDGLSADEVSTEERNCLRHGWRYRALAAAHDAMVTAPKELAAVLLEATA